MKKWPMVTAMLMVAFLMTPTCTVVAQGNPFADDVIQTPTVVTTIVQEVSPDPIVQEVSPDQTVQEFASVETAPRPVPIAFVSTMAVDSKQTFRKKKLEWTSSRHLIVLNRGETNPTKALITTTTTSTESRSRQRYHHRRNGGIVTRSEWSTRTKSSLN